MKMTSPAVAIPGSLPDGWIKRGVGILLSFHIMVSYLLVNQVLEPEIHRVDPEFGSTITVSSRDSQSTCWVTWKLMGQPCEFYLQVLASKCLRDHWPRTVPAGWIAVGVEVI
jgi:hypothetical protein